MTEDIKQMIIKVERYAYDVKDLSAEDFKKLNDLRNALLSALQIDYKDFHLPKQDLFTEDK